MLCAAAAISLQQFGDTNPHQLRWSGAGSLAQVKNSVLTAMESCLSWLNTIEQLPVWWLLVSTANSRQLLQVQLYINHSFFFCIGECPRQAVRGTLAKCYDWNNPAWNAGKIGTDGLIVWLTRWFSCPPSHLLAGSNRPCLFQFQMHIREDHSHVISKRCGPGLLRMYCLSL